VARTAEEIEKLGITK